MRDTAKYLGMAAANLVLVVDPEMLVLGGIMADRRGPAARAGADRDRTPIAAVDDRRARDRDRHARRGRRRDRRGTTGAPRTPMIVLSGAALVLPDRMLSPGTLVIEDGRIAEIRPDAATPHGPSSFAFHGHYIVPGFIDVHVHGVDGVDSLEDPGDPIAFDRRAAAAYGVTAFCPTTVACPPGCSVACSTRSAARAKRRAAARRASCPRISRAISSTRNTGVRSLRAACAARGLRWGRRESGGSSGGAGEPASPKREASAERRTSTAPTSSPRSSARRRMSGSSPSRRSSTAGSI